MQFICNSNNFNLSCTNENCATLVTLPLFSMTYKQDIGAQGEEMAVKYLEENQFKILHRNWRFKNHEVDLIALKNNKLHFVEVKTRTGLQFGYPEESISNRKMNSLKKAAVAFLEMHTEHSQLQFDVIAIILYRYKPAEIICIADVFF